LNIGGKKERFTASSPERSLRKEKREKKLAII